MQTATKSSIAKIISRILAAVSIGIIARIFVPVIWYWIGFEVIAALLVTIGCAGEWCLHHHAAGRKKVEKEEHHKLESRFIAAVVIGVFMEFLALTHAIPAAMQLEKDVAVAYERASTNQLEVVKLQRENFLIRSGWREISEQNSNIITSELKHMPPLNVKIMRAANGGETLHFISLLKSIFKHGGAEVNDWLNWPKHEHRVLVVWKNWDLYLTNGQPNALGEPVTAKMQISYAIFNQIGQDLVFDDDLFVDKTNIDCDLEIIVGDNK